MHKKAVLFATVMTTATLLSHSAWAFFGMLDSATTFREDQKDSITPAYDELPPGPPADLYYNTREGEAWSRYYTRTDLQAVPYMQGSASMVMRPNGPANMAHYGPDGRPAVGPDGRPVQGYDTLSRRDMINKGRKKADDGNIFIGEAGTYPPGLVEPGVWPGAERDLGVKSRIGKPKQEWNPRPQQPTIEARPGDFNYGQQIASQQPTFDEGGDLPPFRQPYDGPSDPYGAARSPLPTNDDPNFGLNDDTMRNMNSLADQPRDGARVPDGAMANYGDTQPRNPYTTPQGANSAGNNVGSNAGNNAAATTPPAYNNGGAGNTGANANNLTGNNTPPSYNTLADEPRGQAVVPNGQPYDAGRNPDGTYGKGNYTDEAMGYSDAAPNQFPTPEGAQVNVNPQQRMNTSSGAASSTDYGALPNTYIVQPGDSLSGISDQEQIYGDWKLWPLIYDANRDQIDDPDLIHPEQNLGIPRDYTMEQMDSARGRGEQKTAPYLYDDGQ